MRNFIVRLFNLIPIHFIYYANWKSKFIKILKNLHPPASAHILTPFSAVEHWLRTYNIATMLKLYGALSLQLKSSKFY